MEYIKITWINWITVAALLGALFLLLRFLDRRLSRVNFLGKSQEPIQQIIHSLLLIYEPLALIVLGVGFVFINPLFHGLALGLLLLASFSQVRNYFNGRIVLFDKNLKPGIKLSSEKLNGVVSEMGRLGLRLKNSKGLHFINYSNLLDKGYLLHSGEEVGGYYELKMSPINPDKNLLPNETVMDLFAAAPYLDWGVKPKITFSKKNQGHLKARISLKEENHLQDLLLLIEEWGYEIELTKN